MASATVDSAATTTAVHSGSLGVDSIPVVDLRLLSQSELYSLTLCSSAAVDPSRCDDVVIPKIDRSVFNESAGSRKQTYARLRLAPPSSSSSSLPRRRTPHLRPTATSFAYNNSNSDPDNAENARIVTLLKKLFVPDFKPEELVPVRIDYSGELNPIKTDFSGLVPVETDCSASVTVETDYPGELVPVKLDYSYSDLSPQSPSLTPSPPSNGGLAGHKRKRGRRPRDQILGNERETAWGVSVVDVNENADRLSSLNGVIVHENVEDEDKEVLNGDGVAVDLVTLGVVEHPYSEEIRRRTEGLVTEEELLRFLDGLNGQWGSKRKKRRIVDAREFGTTLPIGWKLLLSVKKKNGQAWLYSRRYISPSGLQFVSCKEVCSYLLSLHGVQNANPHSAAHHIEIVNNADQEANPHSSAQHNEIVSSAAQEANPHSSAPHNEIVSNAGQEANPQSYAQHNKIVNNSDNKLTSVSVSDLGLQDDGRKENIVSLASSHAVGSASADQVIQIVVNAEDRPKDRVGETAHCNKCNMTFSNKDELLQHRSSLHRRNRYRHGVRITDGVIIKDGKYECQFCHKVFSERHRYNGHVGAHVRYQAKAAGESPAGGLVEYVGPSSFGEFPVQDSLTKQSLESGDGVEICNVSTASEQNLCAPYYEKADQVEELAEANGGMKGADEATDRVTATSSCAVAEVLFSSNENKSFPQASDSAGLNGCAAEVIDDGSCLHGRGSGNCFPLPSSDTPDVAVNCAVENSASMEMPQEKIMSESSLFDSDNKATYGAVNGVIENSASTEKLEEKMASESSLFDSNNPMEACDIVVNNEDIMRNDLNFDCENFAVNGSVFDFFGSNDIQDKDVAVSSKLSVSENLAFQNIGTADNTLSSASIGSRVDSDAVIRHKEMQFGSSSPIPSWDKTENVSKNYDAMDFTGLLEAGLQNTSRSSLFTFSGNESIYSAQNDADEAPGRKMRVLEFDGLQNFKGGETDDTFPCSHAMEYTSSMTGTEPDRKFGVCSAFASAADKPFLIEDVAVEEHKKEQSGNALLTQPGISGVFDEGFTWNKMHNVPANKTKLDEIEKRGKHELSLSFGDLRTEVCTDSNRVEQERYPSASFNIEPVVLKTSGVQTHMGLINSNKPADQKPGRPFAMDFPDLSFNNRSHELGSNFSMTDQTRNWSGSSGNNIGTSGQNSMFGFGNSSLQSGNCVTADGSWRTGHGNVFQGYFDAGPSSQVEPSSSFRSFDLTSDKCEQGSLGGDKTNVFGTDMLRLGRTEPVEYSFMGGQSSNALPGESKIFSYNANVEQGLDPSFWLGKDALMPNIAAHSNLVRSICIWCRNEFFQQPIQPGTQTGAIGSMCPSCSSKFPGQFNVL